MLRSFVASDVYRIMLGCASRETLLAAIRSENIDHDGATRVMRRDDGYAMSIAVLLVDGDMLQRLALHADLQLMQIDNVSARLREVPMLAARQHQGSRGLFAARGYNVAT